MSLSKKIYNTISFVLIIICLSLLYSVYSAFHEIDKEEIVIIPRGSSILQTSRILDRAKIVDNGKIFFILSCYYDFVLDKKLKAGEYGFSKGSNTIDVLKKILNGEVIKYKVTIPEGYLSFQILKTLQSIPRFHNDVSKHFSEILSANHDGTLLPETYTYEYDTKYSDILSYMKRDMKLFFDKEYLSRDKRIDNYLDTKEKIIIMASILQREAFFDGEMPRIAGVYLNRLKINMPLQADPTIIYGMLKNHDFHGNLGHKLSLKDLKYKSPYNTYLNKGLPPGPICNPGKKAILAALHPEWHRYLYFVMSQKGHVFSRDFETHKKYKKDIANNKKEMIKEAKNNPK